MLQKLDQLLVDRELTPSCQQAQILIRAGNVRVNGQLIDQPATKVDSQALITLKVIPRFVSRGGEKLLGALEVFGVEVAGRIGLDGGISSGGFTDCLLQKGAAQVYGIDVGYGQVAWTLRTDPRVTLKERTNLRYLTPEQLYPELAARADLAVVDVSFISLTKILPALKTLLVAPYEALLLVKPQFECERNQAGRGVVFDPLVHQEVMHRVADKAKTLGWSVQAATWSPLTGPEGNIEYWLQLGSGQPLATDTLNETVTAAHLFFANKKPTSV